MFYQIRDEGVWLTVKVRTNAPRSMVQEVTPSVVKIALHAAPVDGEANLELINFLADLFGIIKKEVVIIRGLRSHQKIIKFPYSEGFKTWLKQNE